VKTDPCRIFLIIFIFIALSIPLYSLEEPAPEGKKFSLFDIFSYEHPVEKGENEKKWSFNAGGGYLKLQGNIESMDCTYSTALKFNNNITTLKLSWLGFYGETNDKRDENRWYAQGNFDHYLVSRLEFFSFTMSDYNEILGLHHRNDSGAGLKLIFIRNKYLLVDLSGAPVYQYEKFKDREKEDEWRWSVRWRGEIAPFRDDISLRYYGYYIPVFGETDNYRLIQDVYLYFKLSGYLGLRAGYRRDFNTYTPELLEAMPALKKTDETTYIQLTISI